MSIIRREPFGDFLSLRDAVDRLFEDSFVRSVRPGSTERAYSLPVDAHATEGELVIMANIPGVDANDVHITIDGDTLTIKGETRPPLQNVTYLFQERRFGPFYRQLQINVPVEADKAEAPFSKVAS
ncbi:MAG: Hsp20/alpha crystallin family protein, partial [Anaerolineae bacterium]|nr:Hsp20/alpha crystallin family protein [Anaerolineae bacterium]